MSIQFFIFFLVRDDFKQSRLSPTVGISWQIGCNRKAKLLVSEHFRKVQKG